MSEILFKNGRILTIAGEDRQPRRNNALRELGAIDSGWVLTKDGLISEVGDGPAPDTRGRVIDLEGRVLMPGFVDCHTHACWAGSRYDEFDRKLAGASYLELLAEGGGIMSTVHAVRRASVEELTSNLIHRIEQMARLGTTTVEVKSGYGLSTEAELKMLDAIRIAAERMQSTVVGTFLGAHAIDRDAPDFVRTTINTTLPAVVEANPGITCDAYCEEGAWSLEDCRTLFEEAQSMGCPIRVHADQFHSLGATHFAVEAGARSVDHLEATTNAELGILAHSDTMGVLLPCSGYHLDDRYAAGRALIDLGGAVAIASNCNPGSAPTPSIPFTIHLAVNRCRLKPAEAIVAATYNAACVLDLQDDRGSIEEGKRSDLIVLDTCDERSLAWEFAAPGPRMVMIGDSLHDLTPFGG